jgi:hypothetical protein
MPCLVGAVEIINVQPGAIVNGPSLQFRPSNTSKTFVGGGLFLAGDLFKSNYT